MNRNDDNEIKKLFQQMKEEDVRVIPSFSKSLEIGSSKVKKEFRHPFLKVAATCALLILFGAGFFLWHQRTIKLRKYPSISQWQPPTQFLLKTPGGEWLKTVPKVGQSLEQKNRRK